MDAPANQPHAFTVSQFCKRNNMSRTTFYELLKSGDLKAKKRGSRTIVLASDEMVWLNSLPDYEAVTGQQRPGGSVH